MIKVRVKVKTLIKIIIGILFFIIFIVPSISMELGNHYINKYRMNKAEKFYDYYIKYPFGLRKDEALYKRSKCLMNNYIRYFIFLDQKQGGSVIDKDAVSKVVEINKRIIEDYPKSKYYSNAYRNILDTYIYSSNSKELKKWIAWGKEHDNEEIKRISILYDGYVYFVNRKYDEAERILTDYTMGIRDLDYIYYFLKGHIAFAREDFEKVEGYYKEAQDIRWGTDFSFFGTPVPYDRLYWLSELKFFSGQNRIKGRVTVDGVGIPFIEVYIQYTYEGISFPYNNFVAITDENGYFETIGIKDGEYNIGIGIGYPLLFDKVYLDKNIRSIKVDGDMEFNFEFTTPMRIISPKPGEIVEDNKFIVEWEEVEGADYYIVNSVAFENPEDKRNNIMTFWIKDENREYEIRDTKAVFDLDILNNEESLLGKILYSGDKLINPYFIIGYFHRGMEIPIIVNAYDRNGNKLNSSIPLATYYENVPSIKIEYGDFTYGEKLILDEKYEEAISYYENLLKEDNNNIEALRYLSRIYMVNWDEGKKDIRKSVDYAIKLYDLTGETDLLKALLFHIRFEEREQYKDLVEMINNILSKEDS